MIFLNDVENGGEASGPLKYDELMSYGARESIYIGRPLAIVWLVVELWVTCKSLDGLWRRRNVYL
jgi:hypothetical protein